MSSQRAGSWFRRSLAARFFLFHLVVVLVVAVVARFVYASALPWPDVVMAAVIVVMAALSALGLRLWLVPAMEEIVRVLSKVTDDIDVSTRVRYRADHELGRISHGINRVLKGFHRILLRIRDHSRKISEGITEMAAMSAQSAEWAKRISASMDSFVSAMAEQSRLAQLSGSTARDMARTVAEAGEKVKESSEEAFRARGELEKGLKTVEEIQKQMTGTVTAVHDMASSVEQLGTLSSRIGEITSWIGNIASQTHMLALNAAIEAARAGEQGRGFAVVAQEVQKLASNAGRAVEQIGQLITQVREQVVKSIEQTRRAQALVDEQQSLSEAVARAFLDVSDSVGNVHRELQAMTEVYRVLVQGNDTVLQAVEDVIKNAGQLTGAVDEVYAAIQQQTATASEIAGEAERIRNLIAEMEHEAVRWKGLDG